MKQIVSLFALVVIFSCSTKQKDQKIDGPFSPWPSYNLGLESQRYSDLTKITPANVATLNKVCEIVLDDKGPFQSGPLMIEGIVYVTTAHTTIAVNGTNCALLWQHRYAPEEKELYPVNRGVAYSEGKIFRVTADTRLLAIDSKTGKELWRKKIGDPSAREWHSAAPIIWNKMIFIGVAGGDIGARGRISAFSTESGNELWRFNIIPKEEEPTFKTWQLLPGTAPAGGTTWTSYSLDPQTGELFVPTGSPTPDYLGKETSSGNPYTGSVVVLDAVTGQLKWHYRVPTKNGVFYDVTSAPLLHKSSSQEPRVVLGSKDGHIYSIGRDRRDLKFKVPVTTLKNHDQKPTEAGISVCPGGQGGILWNGPAYNPQLNILVVGSVDWCAIAKLQTTPGKTYPVKRYTQDPPEQAKGWIYGLNADSGKVLWKIQTPAPVVSGITFTATGLVLAGDLKGNLMALDANTGQVHLTKNLGGPMAGGLITYLIGQEQFVAATAGNESQKTFVTTGKPTLFILKTDLPKDSDVRIDLSQPSK